MLSNRLRQVLRNGVAQSLFAGGSDADSSFEHFPRRFARTESGEVHLLRDQLEGTVDVVIELRFFDFDVQLDFVALEGLDRTLHRSASVSADSKSRIGL